MMRRNLFITAPLVLVFGIVLASGCYVEVDDGYVPSGSVEIEVDTTVASLTDLQVDWTIDHSDAAMLCSIYGVDRWEVSIHGPESRDTILDCRTNWWSTEADFFELAVGSYRVTVTAVDDFGLIIGSVSTSIAAYDYSENLSINFDGATL